MSLLLQFETKVLDKQWKLVSQRSAVYPTYIRLFYLNVSVSITATMPFFEHHVSIWSIDSF